MPASLSTVMVSAWRSMSRCWIFINFPLLPAGGTGGGPVLSTGSAPYLPVIPPTSGRGTGPLRSARPPPLHQRLRFVVHRTGMDIAIKQHFGMGRAAGDHREAVGLLR